MGRYNLIQIGSIYLTNTGLVGGTPCKTNVNGLELLKPAYRKSVIKAIDGTPFGQKYTGIKGIDLEIAIDWLAKSVYDSINSLFDTADSTDAVIAIVITGDFGTYSLNIKPNSDYVRSDKFSSGILQNVKYRMVTA